MNAFAAALALIFTTFGPVSAAEVAVSNAFTALGTITQAYRTRGIAANAGQVLRQGGFAVPGAVRWLPTAPATREAQATNVRLGAL
ncbi:hypothetical protein [Methylobacterium trifolii]|nr:hypothetical protein [Methylobacterium trifolii]